MYRVRIARRENSTPTDPHTVEFAPLSKPREREAERTKLTSRVMATPSGTKRHGFRAFLKRNFYHEKSGDDESRATGDIEDTASIKIETRDSPRPDGKGRLLQAKKELEAAVVTLNEAMSRISDQLQVPEAIGLQNLNDANDIQATARDIETAIDNIIDARKLKLANAGSREVWKNCVKGWYKAAFPYVKPCVDSIGVYPF